MDEIYVIEIGFGYGGHEMYYIAHRGDDVSSNKMYKFIEHELIYDIIDELGKRIIDDYFSDHVEYVNDITVNLMHDMVYECVLEMIHFDELEVDLYDLAYVDVLPWSILNSNPELIEDYRKYLSRDKIITEILKE